MKKYVEVKISDNQPETIFVEVQAIEATRGDSKRGVTETVQSLENSFSKLKPALNSIVGVLKEINTPDEISLEVGLTFSATAGIMIASLDTETSFKVTLKWQNK